jgi:aryl-alcohol dehydrogenase-like predicted oxidoreductase
MKYTAFRSGEEMVSRIGYGAMGLGGAFGTHSENELIRSIHLSLEKGVNFIDTARTYGDSERLVGKALKEWSGERPFLATKVQSLYPGGVGWGRPVPIFFEVVPREMYIERVNRLLKFIPEYADNLAELAIKYVLYHPGVTTALVSMHVPEYAEQNIATLDKEPLPAQVFEEIFKYHRWIRNFYDNKFWD